MTDHPTSISFPRGAECNRTEAEYRASRAASPLRFGVASIIALFAKPSMSDDQLGEEYKLQQRLYEAIGDFRAVMESVNRGSAVAQINLTAFDDFLHDEMPKISWWDEKISDARRT
jgi:hypothetical protein